MNDIQSELAARAANGYRPSTVKAMTQTLRSIGYRLDRSMDCKHQSRYMTGPRAGSSYPAISTGIREIDSGKSFAHFDARRDENFKKLQDMRLNESLYAVVAGRILDI